MSNATANIKVETVGQAGQIFDMPVAASKHIYMGTILSQLTSGGAVVPYSTASSEHAIGVATHESDNSATATDGAKRVRVETGRIFPFINGTSSDAFADTDIIGAPVYGTDDHTVAKTSNSNARKIVGFFMGFEDDGKVRVLINPALNRLYAQLAGLTDSPSTADSLRDDIITKVAT